MKEKKNTFLDAAVILFFLTFVNKLLGFVKSMTIASIYGATIQTDAYYVAEGLMQNVLISISEALAVSFLPIYISIREKDKEDSKGYKPDDDRCIHTSNFCIGCIVYFSTDIISRLVFGIHIGRITVSCVLFSDYGMGNVFLHVQSIITKFA